MHCLPSQQAHSQPRDKAPQQSSVLSLPSTPCIGRRCRLAAHLDLLLRVHGRWASKTLSFMYTRILHIERTYASQSDACPGRELPLLFHCNRQRAISRNGLNSMMHMPQTGNCAGQRALPGNIMHCPGRKFQHLVVAGDGDHDLRRRQVRPGSLPAHHLPEQDPECIHICSLHGVEQSQAL